MSRSLVSLAAAASPAARALAVTVLEQDVSDQAWAEQIGPALTQADVARLLGKSEQAVSKDRRLLRLDGRDGRVAYPVVQFDGRRQRPGVAEVLKVLEGVVVPLTVASWLTAPHRGLGGRRPIDALAEGDREAVVAAAERLAADLA